MDVTANGHDSYWTFSHSHTTANGRYSTKTKTLIDATAKECYSTCILYRWTQPLHNITAHGQKNSIECY